MVALSGSPLRLGVTSLSRRREIPAIRALRDRSAAITSCTPHERAPSHSLRNLRGLLRPADLAPRRRPAFQLQAPPQSPAKGGAVKGAEKVVDPPRSRRVNAGRTASAYDALRASPPSPIFRTTKWLGLPAFARARVV